MPVRDNLLSNLLPAPGTQPATGGHEGRQHLGLAVGEKRVRGQDDHLHALTRHRAVDANGAAIRRVLAGVFEQVSQHLLQPVGITIDHETIRDGTVTLRDRDSMAQVRLPEDRLVAELTARTG